MAEGAEDLELRALDVGLETEGIGCRHPAILAAPYDERRDVHALQRRRIERLLRAGALQGGLAVAREALQLGGAPDPLGRGLGGIGIGVGKGAPHLAFGLEVDADIAQQRRAGEPSHQRRICFAVARVAG